MHPLALKNRAVSGAYCRFAAIAITALAISGCQKVAQDVAQNVVEKLPASNASNAASVATTRPSEPVRAFARGLHLVPGLGPLSLTATRARSSSPASNPTGQTFSKGLTFGNATPYEGIKEAAGQGTKLQIQAYGSDGKKVVGPMPITLDPGEDLTVFVTGFPGDVELLPFKPKNYGTERGKAKVAFIHAGKALPKVDVSLDGKVIRDAAKFGIATRYHVLTPGRHFMEVQYDKSLPPTVIEVEQPTIITQDEMGNVVDVTQPPPSKTVVPRKTLVTLNQEMDLAPGKVYEVILFHGVNKVPQLRLLEDRFADELIKAKPAEH
jgi:hypothetical protein